MTHPQLLIGIQQHGNVLARLQSSDNQHESASNLQRLHGFLDFLRRNIARVNRIRGQVDSCHLLSIDVEQFDQIHARRLTVGDDMIRGRNGPPYLIEIIAPALRGEKLWIVHKRQIMHGDDATFSSGDRRDKVGAMEHIQIAPG